ncbi:MAG: TIGR00730 family Rossman fold protein [Terriglobia bacterium]
MAEQERENQKIEGLANKNLRACVYCGSSRQCDPAYLDAAKVLGRQLAKNRITVVYGGGGSGLMGRLADGALAEGGAVIGILPRFMDELEWGHRGLAELRLVNDMHERKRLMISGADAVIALPGGCGTLEELLEAITLKRLGLYRGPIILVNTLRFFDPLIETLDRCVAQRFMHERHKSMWTVVADPEEVVGAIQSAPLWDEDCLKFAAL